MTSILVTGGTGTLGSQLVPLLRAAGLDLRVLSRSARIPADGVHDVTGDLLKNEGVDAAVAGVETVVHLAGGAKGDDVATRHLTAAAARAGVRHFVYIGVTAAEKLPFGYFRAKLAAEEAVIESGVPWTIVRAAQFHDFALMSASKMAKSPLVPAPHGLRFQPVDARDVAERLGELALGDPAGRVPDLVGPEVYSMKELTRSYLKASGKHRLTVRVRIPGKGGRVYRAGENLVLAGADRGERTWDAFLAERVG